VPILRDGAFSLCQSSAIYQHVARKVGLNQRQQPASTTSKRPM
jgi:glutathione S-transferase